MRSNKGKKIKQKTGNRQVQRNNILAGAAAIILLVLAVYYFTSQTSGSTWSVSSDGLLSYDGNRGRVDVSVLKTEQYGSYTIETISFPSKDYIVEAILRVPSSAGKVPGVVILPGATVSKEGTKGMAELLSGMGYASIGIQQRNLGGVDMENDYKLFRSGNEPVEHKMVFDALRAADVLRQDERIDAKRIAVIGESNGGRFAIIAAAIDMDVKGVIGISTSGYDVGSQLSGVTDETALRFYRSIDPDTYLDLIPPRKLVMMHSVNDNVIPIAYAENTFRKAGEPKTFYNVTTGSHGFSDGMKEPLETELRLMFR